MIVLVGFMGAGKTTVGRILASMIGLPFIDIDERIEASEQREIRDIFTTHGEPVFRSLERDAIAAATAGERAIVSVGGGALGDPQTRTDLGWHDVVHLDVSFVEAMRRVGSGETRPMLSAGDPKALYDERRLQYETLAQTTVVTDGKKPEEVAIEIARVLGLETTEGLRRVVVDVARPYDVIVGSGIAPRLDEFLPELPGAESAFVVTHPSLRTIAAPVMGALTRTGLNVRALEVPEGEGAKSLGQATELYSQLAAAAAHRHDLIVSVGGGVIGDLAAFVASTYNRGMPVVHVASTLLAQVDAAIGGKTGVNLPAGKNLVGTIHQPYAVICDVDTLDSLPDEELVGGSAEVAKYGFIEDPGLLDLLVTGASSLRARDPQLLQDVVARCVAIKGAIVAVDERETGVRAILNYGHTFAHALEQSADFSLRHGEAVALGMMAAAYLAHDLRRIEPEIVDRHKEVLQALGLPVRAKLDIDVLEKAWVRDKKYQGGVRFVLLAGLGKAEAGVTVPRSAIVRALERMNE